MAAVPGMNQPCVDLRTGRCYITSQSRPPACEASLPHKCTENTLDVSVQPSVHGAQSGQVIAEMNGLVLLGSQGGKLALSGSARIPARNHGFAVDEFSLPDGWVPLFTNANVGASS